MARALDILRQVEDVGGRGELRARFRAAMQIYSGDILLEDSKVQNHDVRLAWARKLWGKKQHVQYADLVHDIAVPREAKLLADGDGATDADVFAIIDKYLPAIIEIEIQ